MPLPQLLEDREPVLLGQHDVEHHHVGLLLQRELESLASVAGREHVVAFELEVVLQPFDEPFLVLGTELAECSKLVLFEQPCGQIELGLDVRLGPSGPDVTGVTLGTKEKADRLRENRLARPGLAGDRVEPRTERQLCLFDEDEVLDAEAAEHGAAEIVGAPAARHHRPVDPRPLEVHASSAGTPHLPPLRRA